MICRFADKLWNVAGDQLRQPLGTTTTFVEHRTFVTCLLTQLQKRKEPSTTVRHGFNALPLQDRLKFMTKFQIVFSIRSKFKYMYLLFNRIGVAGYKKFSHFK